MQVPERRAAAKRRSLMMCAAGLLMLGSGASAAPVQRQYADATITSSAGLAVLPRAASVADLQAWDTRRRMLWPTHGWASSTPEEQGIDSNVLAAALETIRTRHLPVHSLLIERHGKIVLDAYFAPFADNQLHDVASVTKSVVATLVGVAVRERRLASLDTPVVSLLPEAEAGSDARKARITLAHALSMTSGLDCSSDGGRNFLQQMEGSPHWTAFALERAQTAEPGSTFTYCAGNMHIVSAVLTRTMGESAASIAQRELFAPLGIERAVWASDRDGVSHGFADLKLQPRDMAKLGYLWLHRGRWENRQIVPADYLEAALSPHASVLPGVAYGYGMWIYPERGHTGGPADFEANGYGGQRIAVVPEQDMVEVITGAGLNADDAATLLTTAPRSDSALPADPVAFARLENCVTAAAGGSSVRYASSRRSGTRQPTRTAALGAPKRALPYPQLFDRPPLPERGRRCLAPSKPNTELLVSCSVDRGRQPRFLMTQPFPAVLDWTTRLETLKSSADAWRSFLNFAERYGFTHGVVSDLPRRAERHGNRLLCVNWPESWRQRYRELNYLWRDPSVRGVLHTSEPFTWDEGLAFENYDRASRNIVGEAAEFGLHSGFVVPINGSGGNAVLTMAGEQNFLSKRERAELHFAAIYAHARIRELWPEKPRQTLFPQLTERERECLEWASLGKSDWEIGEILSISERTVGSHIDHARQKFGASTRIYAVVLAMQCGAIRP